MQLREDAAREWADAEGIEAFEHEHCLNPVTNTLAGAFYLGKLLKRFRAGRRSPPYALAAYNAGRSNALKWATGEAATNSARFIEQIAFPATRAYVLAVLDRARKYQRDFPPLRAHERGIAAPRGKSSLPRPGACPDTLRPGPVNPT